MTFTYLIPPYYSKIFCCFSLLHSFCSIYVFICSPLRLLEEEGSCKFYIFLDLQYHLYQQNEICLKSTVEKYIYLYSSPFSL